MSFTHNGERFKRSTETSDKKLATRIFDKVKGEIAERKWFKKLPGENHTLCDLVQKYLTRYSSTNKVGTFYKRDKSLAAHLLKSFGNIKLLKITAPMISDYKGFMRCRGWAGGKMVRWSCDTPTIIPRISGLP